MKRGVCYSSGALLVSWLFAVGCGDPRTETEPMAPAAPSLDEAWVVDCPLPSDHVVTSESELNEALAEASPGEVIGLRGFFPITDVIRVEKEGVTLTCDTPGSGIFAEAVGHDLLRVGARGVKINRLVLERPTGGKLIRAVNDEFDDFAEDLEFTKNKLVCRMSGGACTMFMGVKGALIADNYLEYYGSSGGFHVEGYGTRTNGLSRVQSDNVQVVRNTVVALAPQTGGGNQGGIRVRDGSNMVVSHNIVRGPWLNSITTAELYNSRIEHNHLEGPLWFGIFLSTNPFTEVSTADNVIRNNVIKGAGSTGIYSRKARNNLITANEVTGAGDVWIWVGNLACGNHFTDNLLDGQAGAVAAFFDVQSGLNTLWPIGNNIVQDDGDFDCDGDGIPDPNFFPEPVLESLVADLASYITEFPSAEDKLEDVIAKTEVVLEELRKTPSDRHAAMGSLEGAVGDLEAAVEDGEVGHDEGVSFLDRFTDVARKLAVYSISQAIIQGGDPSKVQEAQDYLAEGDALRLEEKYKDAVDKYKDAVDKYEDAVEKTEVSW